MLSDSFLPLYPLEERKKHGGGGGEGESENESKIERVSIHHECKISLYNNTVSKYCTARNFCQQKILLLC